MRPTLRLLARPPGFPSFMKRSLEEIKVFSQTVMNLDSLYEEKDVMKLWDFADPSSVEACTDMCDADIGGFSTVKFEHVPATDTEPAHARFSGSISNKLPDEENNVQRTGYAAWRTRDRPATIFGKTLWDVEQFSHLALRVKVDHRKYKVNIQSETIEYTDIHQHRLYPRRSAQWETVLIRWKDFVRTNHGMVVEPQSEMLRDKVRTIGIGLTDRLPGPFELCIQGMWATNRLPEVEIDGTGPSVRTYVPKGRKTPNAGNATHEGQ